MAKKILQTKRSLEWAHEVLSRKRINPTLKQEALATIEHWSKAFPNLDTANTVIVAIGHSQPNGSVDSVIQLSGEYCQLTRAYTAIGYRIFVDNPYNRNNPKLHPYGPSPQADELEDDSDES